MHVDKSGVLKVLLGAVLGASGLFAVLFLTGNLSFDNAKGITIEDDNSGQAPNSQSTNDRTPESDQEALDELAAILINSMDVIDDLGTHDNLDGIDTKAYFEDLSAKLGRYIDGARDYETEAGKIRDLDTKVVTAKAAYFDMFISSMSTLKETCDFMGTYCLVMEYCVDMPTIDKYDTLEDYYNALDAWYQETSEFYRSMTDIPECVTAEWDNLGGHIDLANIIVYKAYYADQYDDYLRYNSGINLTDRYFTLVAKSAEDLGEAIMNEIQFAATQFTAAADLGDEIVAYTSMNPRGRRHYAFTRIRDGELNIDYQTESTIYPSLYNTYDAFAIIRTGCFAGTRKVVIEAEIEGLTQKHRETYKLNSSFKSIYIKPPALSGELNLTSSKEGQLKIDIYEQDGKTLIESKSFPISIKSVNDVVWYNDDYGTATRDNILCYLTPESSDIAQLKREAIDYISEMTDGDMQALTGYQESQWNHYVTTYIQVAGLMRAMYEDGVRYTMDPFSIDSNSQHILLPNQVLEQNTGLCIETSLVIASALQSAGMHTFLIFPEGHAQVAVEVWNDGTDKTTEGEGKYFLIETTSLTSDNNNNDIFVDGANLLTDYQATDYPIMYLGPEEWKEYLNECRYMIDCDDSRLLGLTPFTN